MGIRLLSGKPGTVVVMGDGDIGFRLVGYGDGPGEAEMYGLGFIEGPAGEVGREVDPSEFREPETDVFLMFKSVESLDVFLGALAELRGQMGGSDADRG